MARTSCYKQALIYTSAKTKSPLHSSCKFSIEDISDQDVKHLVTVASLVLPTWDIAAYKADTFLSMRKALTDLVMVFNSMAHDWHNGGCEFLSILDSLAQFKFPETLKGQLEMTDRITNTVLEKINMLGCVSGNNAMSCELEVGVPTKLTKVRDDTA